MGFLVALCVSTFSRQQSIELTLEMSTTTGDIGQVFYAGPGQEMSGGRSIQFRLGRGFREYRVQLPDEALGTLRLDPGTEPGSVSIRRLTLRKGTKVLKLIDGPRLARLSGTHSMERDGAAPDATTFSATDLDPFMVFAIPPGFSGARWHRALGWGLLSAVVFALGDMIVTALLRRRPDQAQRWKTRHETFRQRLKHPICRWFTLVLAPAAGLLWARGHVLPTVMCLSLCLALASTAVAGAVAQSWIEGLRGPSAEGAHRPGLFQVLWLGQYAMFGLALLVSPFAALFTDLTGIHVSYRFSLPLLLVALAFITQRVARARGASLAWPSATTAPPAALVLLVVFRAMYMHSVHAGAIGHDTEQHIYWTQHIVDYGFLALTARGTDVLDDYPKFFHLLSAAWSALGLNTIVGPFVKLMPALQTALACACLCELLPSFLDGPARRGRSVLRVTLGVFLAWHLTYGDGQQIYDGNDLSGTPRLAAAWVVLGLPLLFLAHHAGTIRGASPWILGMVPVLPTIGLGVNPVLIPIYLSYSLPLTAVLAAVTRDRGALRLPPRWWRHLALGVVVSVLLLLANPYIVQRLAKTGPGAAVVASLGIRTVLAGIADPPSTTPPPELCNTPLATCLSDLAMSSVEEGAHRFVDSIRQANLPAFGGGQYSFVYWLLFSAPLLVTAFHRLAKPGASSQPSRNGARTFLAILSASVFPALVYPMARTLFEKLAAQNSAFFLLGAYYGSLQMFLGAWVRCLLPLSSWLLLPACSIRGGGSIMGWLIAAGAALVGISNFQIDSLAAHRNAMRPWIIDWPELRALRHLDEFVPEHEAVLMPARHVLAFGRENLLMTSDPTGAVGPLLKTRMLFMVRLGTSLDFGWRDLSQRFCGDPEDRRSLLRAANARWVLVRAKEPRAEGHLDADFWRCGVTLRTLEAEYPPAWSERDLALYRINP